jgi:hypoxanthine phosphoribosyltransferase
MFSEDDILWTGKELKERSASIAAQISEDYADSEPVLISVLRGGVVFLADLVRAMKIPHSVDFIAVDRPRFDPSARVHAPVNILADVRMPIEGRDVIVVEGIVGTGYTLRYVLSYLELSHPRSVSIATMFNRRMQRKFYFPIRYVGFQIDDEFVVGYGLDHQQKYRHLPFVVRWRGEQ